MEIVLGLLGIVVIVHLYASRQKRYWAAFAESYSRMLLESAEIDRIREKFGDAAAEEENRRRYLR